MFLPGPTNFYYGFPLPGPQSPTAKELMDHVYFCTEQEWKNIREQERFDYIVIGSEFCGLAFVEKVLSKSPMSRILMLERGGYLLPDHFQNLPYAYRRTLHELSVTFPWTLTSETTSGDRIKFLHGMSPYFGGRSIIWSGWCPKPTKEEFAGWPDSVVQSANDYFKDAEKLLNVVSVIPEDDQPNSSAFSKNLRPVYGTLQSKLSNLIKPNLHKVDTLTRSMPAPLAVGVSQIKGIDFEKFATPSAILDLQGESTELEKKKEGSRMKIVTDCILEQIYQQNNKATALKTNKGDLVIGDAKLILAMGTIPPAVLIQNSFDSVPNVGKHLATHFISAIVARISVEDFSFDTKLHDVELGAFYVAGIDETFDRQFHVQLSAFYDKDPEANAKHIYQYSPDVVATVSKAQLESSKDTVLFLLACVGESDVLNERNGIWENASDSDQTTNIFLNLTTNQNDQKLWDVMDGSSFALLEKIIGVNKKVEYWHGTRDDGVWLTERPPKSQFRVPGVLHESSTLIIGDKSTEGTSVGLDYRPHGVENVYVTGAGLWPRGGSWNPTLTMVALTQHLANQLTQ